MDDIIDTTISRDQNFNQWQCSIIVTWLRLYHISYEFWYNFSRQEHQIELTLIDVDQLLKCSDFGLYPFLFFLYTPFNIVSLRQTWT